MSLSSMNYSNIQNDTVLCILSIQEYDFIASSMQHNHSILLMCFVSHQSLIFVAQCHMLLIWSEPLKQEEIKWSKIGVIYAIGYLRTTSPLFFPAEIIILLNFGKNVLRETSPLLGQGMKHEGCRSSSHSPFTGSLDVTEFWSTGLKRKSVVARLLGKVSSW